MLLLLLTNLAVIILALSQGWDFVPLIWVFWCQNIIIGFFNWRRMMQLRHFSTKGLKINGRRVDANVKTKKSVAGFFSLHYVVLHLVYLVFLLPLTKEMPISVVVSASIGIALFLVNHWYSYRHNLRKDLAATPSLATLAIFPYARVVPMHLVIFIGYIIGPHSKVMLISFMLLKTIADLFMHHIERAVWDKAKKT